MPTWLIVLTMASLRAVYSASIEALITWWFLNFIHAGQFKFEYWYCFLIWFVIGLIISSIRFNRVINEVYTDSSDAEDDLE
jgi:uncharacterized membrane protein YkvI